MFQFILYYTRAESIAKVNFLQIFAVFLGNTKILHAKLDLSFFIREKWSMTQKPTGINSPFAVTIPTPESLAFWIASCIAKLPTTGPSRFSPFTYAVAVFSQMIVGSLSLIVVFDFRSFTYISAKEK